MESSTILQILTLILGSSSLSLFAKYFFEAWRKKSGRKRTQEQLLTLYRERLATTKILAIEAGVSVTKLPKDPMLFPHENDL